MKMFIAQFNTQTNQSDKCKGLFLSLYSTLVASLYKRTKGALVLCVFALCTLSSPSIWAQKFDTQKYGSKYFFNSETSADENSRKKLTDYPDFYTIDELDTESAVATVNRRNPHIPDFSTVDGLTNPWVQEIKVIVVNLLKWALHNEPLGSPIEKYSRKNQFGRWINDPNDDTCMNTRAMVLVRDSASDVTFKNEKHCVVESGQWHDPYANQELSSAKEIQIDHLVPLKNAYISGAADWDFNRCCLYANYMNFKPHLVAANAHENMSKGDRGPERYLPPNESYRCEYVRNWLAVKTIWRLKMNRDEVQTIQNIVATYGCDLGSFKMSLDGLAHQREFIESHLDFCTQNR